MKNTLILQLVCKEDQVKELENKGIKAILIDVEKIVLMI